MKILKLAGVLLLICAIVAGVLGAVNAITEDTIAEQKMAKSKKAYEAVLMADTYKALDFDKTAFPTVTDLVQAGGEGYVIKSTFPGAQGSITMAVGVDKALTCTGISVIEHSETSGLGANAAADSEIGRNFRAQFVGQDASVALVSNGGEIDALTGATITTDAIVRAVAESIRIAEAAEGGAAA